MVLAGEGQREVRGDGGFADAAFGRGDGDYFAHGGDAPSGREGPAEFWGRAFAGEALGFGVGGLVEGEQRRESGWALRDGNRARLTSGFSCCRWRAVEKVRRLMAF